MTDRPVHLAGFTRTRFCRVVAVILSSLVLMIGCNREPPVFVSVQGSVRAGDVLLSEGLITFVPQGATAGPKVSAEIKGGHYEVAAEQGMQPGVFRVEVFGIPPGVKAVVQGGEPPATVDSPYREIAAIYNTASGISVTLETGENIENVQVEFDEAKR